MVESAGSNPSINPELQNITSPSSAAHQLTADEAVWAKEATRRVVAQIERVIVGKHSVVELLMIALMAQGHVLIEDIPGVGKTTLAKALAQALGGTFKRVQFTPDLLPGDVTGLTIYNQKSSEFIFAPGPLFTNILLADEINRATPKTQSALLESMEEAQATLDGVTHPLPAPFFVMATQNPIEYRGTYPLPEAQMDRFLLRIHMGYPHKDEEIDMLGRHLEASAHAAHDYSTQSAALLAEVESVLDIESAVQLQRYRTRVTVAPAVREYIVNITHATRQQPRVLLGASPRGALALQRAAQGSALLAGREFVLPDDVKRLVQPVLSHRLIMQEQSGSALGTGAADGVLQEILDELAVP